MRVLVAVCGAPGGAAVAHRLRQQEPPERGVAQHGIEAAVGLEYVEWLEPSSKQGWRSTGTPL